MRGFSWVYGIQSGEYIKVGVAVCVKTRMTTMRLYNPHPLKVVLRRHHEHPYRLERRIHQLLAEVALGREWFDVSPAALRLAADIAASDVLTWKREQFAWEMAHAEKS